MSSFFRYLDKRVPPDYDTVPSHSFLGTHADLAFPVVSIRLPVADQVPRIAGASGMAALNRRQRAQCCSTPYGRR